MSELTQKSRKEQAKIWKARVLFAEKKHKEKIVKWADKVVREYTGDFDGDSDTSEKYRQVAQVIFAVEDTVQPHLFFQNPRMTVKANLKHSPWESREKLVGEMVNQEYRDIKDTGYGIELENERALLDARILGYGVTKTSYDVEGGLLHEEPPANPIDKIKNFLTGEFENEEPEERPTTPVIENEKGHVTEYVSALDVYLDPFANHITRQKMIIHKLDLSLDKLKKSRYEQDKIEKLKPTMLTLPNMHEMTDEERKKAASENPDYNGFRCYEVHDLENRVVHTLVDGFDDFIEFNTPMLVREGSQFNFLWFVDAMTDVYPIPPLKYYRKRALEFSYIYSQISDQIDKFLPKIGVNTQVLDEPDKIKFKNGGLGTLFGTKGPPAGAVSVFTSSGNINDFIKYLAAIKEMLNLESAANAYEVSDPQERTATEANIIQQSTTSRRFKPKKRVAGFIKAQAHTIWQVIRDNAPIDHFIQVLGEKDAIDWWQDPETGKRAWSEPQAVKDYNFDFDVESLAPVDTALRKRQNNESLEAVLNPDLRETLALEHKKLKITPIFERWAEENQGIRDKSQIMEDMNLLTPDQEHSLWMQGQYPPITEDEANNPELLTEHYQSHTAWIQSPGFQYLPDPIKQGAIQHLSSYGPLLERLKQKAAPQKKASSESIPSETGLRREAVAV